MMAEVLASSAQSEENWENLSQNDVNPNCVYQNVGKGKR
jgi:hypothetical protein